MLFRVLARVLLPIVFGSIGLWITAAYGLLPKLWQQSSRTDAEAEALVTHTKEGLPGDPINIAVQGTRGELICLFQRNGWQVPDPATLASSVKITASVATQHGYAKAPVSALFFAGRPQDLAFEKEAGRSANRRHHVRFWQVKPGEWLGAATFDRGSGLNHYTGQVTHHIAWSVDRERDDLSGQLVARGATLGPQRASGLQPNTVLRNGGGDPYTTDGIIKVLKVRAPCHGAIGTIGG